MSTDAPRPLDALTLPLGRNALIEASAGTGKTYTIAALYLRLVLGHGGEAAAGAPLTPPEILVVTFTEAATQELRDRIRARLAEAAQAFRCDPAGVAAQAPGQDLLHDLRASYPHEQWPACARRLQLAAEWMDEAAVSTIHGWCYRMLREHAFDSGSLFTQTLQADQRDLLDEAVRDHWRTFFYPLPPDDARQVREWWGGPDGLRARVERLLPHRADLPDGPGPGEALRVAREQATSRLAELKAPWARWAGELKDLLDRACAARQVDGRKLQTRWFHDWLACLEAWAHDDRAWPLAETSTAWTRLTPDGLAAAWKSGTPIEHPGLAAIQGLPAALKSLPDGRDAVLAHATRWVADRLAREQRRRAEMGFDDLLTQLHRALHDAGNGERLAALIRRQFPVALVDEFQDTDPVQYGIFRRIYGEAADAAMVLIGDPKQAIYAFRGADIHTYLAARRDTEGHLYTLGTNHRSTQAMVDAVNHLFGMAERRSGPGAFLFRAAAQDPLPFLPVRARGRAERWQVQGAEAPALVAWCHDPGRVVRSGDYRDAMAGACAGEIVRLLNLGQQGQAGFVDADGTLQPLRPRDIAVLVNNGSEANCVRRALRTQGVRSVYLSDRDTVFRTRAAAELQRLLQGCAEPDDPRRLRAALGTRLLALDWPALERLNHDELHWEGRVEQFHSYRRQWRRQGVLPMLRRVLHDFGVPARLLAQDDERQLTDLLHLSELLQQASALLQGEHALVRWLAEQREDDLVTAEERQVRLESDADLLKVVTVHKSKGLEYPLVFVPFAVACRPEDGSSPPLRWHDGEGRAHITLSPDDEAVRLADRERLGEDLRKLYVALTRARHATWIGLAPAEAWSKTAIGWLLDEGREPVPGQLRGMLENAFTGCAAISVAEPPLGSEDRYTAAARAPLLPGDTLRAQAQRERWWISSYSRLLGGPAGPAAPQTAEEANYLEDEGVVVVAPPVVPSGRSEGRLHDFPRGAAAGTFLHGLLEWAGREGFPSVAATPNGWQAQWARRCRPAPWAAHEPALREWFASWLQAPLDLSPLAPGSAPVVPAQLGAYQVEMEFWIAATGVDVAALDALVARHTLGGQARPPVLAQQLNGMLKGFIDLVFEHEGRYYVADYKSNWLGADDGAYSPHAMRDEVLRHRYELQYALYLFALHRLLRSRLPDYDYDRHVGGAVYLFLRGHAAPGGGLHLERPSRELVEAMDRLFAGRPAEAAA
ncbi:exodeoxyribonuclease V subunit beta [Ramlibacter sp. Leaf400]|uniref:exodeoxyribonuclease V subunit beta n=1 Tax=Ramlibacter sp. Leaf400 TaxID=1736365 RepID=UPI0006FA76DB|nr:exodeoxyribonuclease V subunit beta [Ramlibacter sp. Leaf400]KQT11614.1 exodeoxyribonuclease V subunit beta [Ramlibacter sp. Leaf400]